MSLNTSGKADMRHFKDKHHIIGDVCFYDKTSLILDVLYLFKI